MKDAYSESGFKSAAELFGKIPGYKDADDLAKKCLERPDECIYDNAVSAMKHAYSESGFKSAAELFGKIPGYKDADALAKQCIERADEFIYACKYNKAVFAMKDAYSESEFKSAAELFGKIPGYKDSDDLAKKCLERADEFNKKIKEAEYEDAMVDFQSFEYDKIKKAMNVFEGMNGWKDSSERVLECRKKLELIVKKEKERERTKNLLVLLFIIVLICLYLYAISLDFPH